MAPYPFGAAVEAPTFRVGENPKLALARTLAALNTANQRLEDDFAWYESIRQNFGAQP